MTKVKKQEKIVKLLSSKKYILLNEEGNNEYDIIEDELEGYKTNYSIHYSNNEMWSDHIKGKMIYSILNDNDDNIIFNESIKLVNYCNADYLRILLNFIIDSGKYKVIETKIIKEI